jgi:hypothetical protein
MVFYFMRLRTVFIILSWLSTSFIPLRNLLRVIDKLLTETVIGL